jgi:hypothetical protein
VAFGVVDVVEQVSGTAALIIRKLALERLEVFGAVALLHCFKHILISAFVDFEDHILDAVVFEVFEVAEAGGRDYLFWSVA